MITEISFKAENVIQMQRYASRIAERITAPCFIALNGNLGSGKTVFVRGFIRAFQNDSDFILRSPSYAIVNEYHYRQTIYHFDVYRLHDMDELYQIGFDDYMSDNAIILMEWAKKFPEVYPNEYIELNISGNGENIREIKIKYTDKFKHVFED